MKNSEKMTFYEVNPRYFKDSSGNGIGDLNGLSSKFDYFEYLGIDAIILQDVLSVDSKDTSQSFKTISKEIGDINQMIKVISLAKKKGKKILIDLKVGNISESTNIFKSALDKDSDKYRQMIDFKNRISDKKVDGIDYKYSKKVEKYYPIDSRTKEVKLNWKSEHVLNHFISIVSFWNNLGINGFVLKDFEFVAEKDYESIMSESTIKELRKFYNSVKEINEEIIIVGKSDTIPIFDSSKYTQGHAKVFDYFMSTKISAIGTSKNFGNDLIGKMSVSSLASSIKKYSKDASNILTFDSSLRGRVQSRWGDSLQFHNESAKALAMLLMINKSSASIYYGNEIGMTNIGLNHLDDFQDSSLEERRTNAIANRIREKDFMDAQVLQGSINARSIMSWSSKKNAGFSISKNTITPISSNYKEINVLDQFNDENSILNFYKSLIKLLKNSPYKKIIENGKQKVNSLIPGVVKSKFSLENMELVLYVNLTESIKIIKRPKVGKIVMSSLSLKDYNELPNRLQAYEAILVTKNIGEFENEIKKVKENHNKERSELITSHKELINVSNEKTNKTNNNSIEMSKINKQNNLEEDNNFYSTQITKFDRQLERAVNKIELEKTKEIRLAEKEKTREIKLEKRRSKEEIKARIIAQRKKAIELEIEQRKLAEKLEISPKEGSKDDELTWGKSIDDEIKSIKLKNSSSEINKAKEAAKNMKEREDSYKDEATLLKEEDIAKTTILEKDIDLDDLFGDSEINIKK